VKDKLINSIIEWFCEMDIDRVLDIIDAVLMPVVILCVGYLITRRQNKIERKHEARIQFEVAEARILGPQAGFYVVELSVTLHNKGFIRPVIQVLNLKVRGIERNENITLLKQDGTPKPANSIAKFPEELVNTNMLKALKTKEKESGSKEQKTEDSVEPEAKQLASSVGKVFKKILQVIKKPKTISYFIEPGVEQRVSYVARIPENIRYILVRAKFKYHKNSKHSAQKIFDLNPMEISLADLVSSDWQMTKVLHKES